MKPYQKAPQKRIKTSPKSQQKVCSQLALKFNLNDHIEWKLLSLTVFQIVDT